jgi:hypothetical protein
MKKREKTALYINILIIVLELIGLITSISNNHRLLLEYYTEDSNIFMLITSTIFTYYLINKKAIPKWLSIIKHMATLGLTITFLVVVLVLAPMYNFNYSWLLFGGSMLYYHTICPILAVITYLFFEKHNIKKKDIPYTMIFTTLYAIIIVICNIYHVIEGPYPFLMIYKQPLYISILWLILIYGGAYIISKVLYKIRRSH